MRKLSSPPTPQYSSDVLVGQQIEEITEALADQIQRTIHAAPPEACGERHFWDIPLREWRRNLASWTVSPFICKAHGADLTRGLGMAIGDFDDDTLEEFLRSFKL